MFDLSPLIFNLMCEFNVKPNPDFILGYKNMVVKERQNPVGIKGQIKTVIAEKRRNIME